MKSPEAYADEINSEAEKITNQLKIGDKYVTLYGSYPNKSVEGHEGLYILVQQNKKYQRKVCLYKIWYKGFLSVNIWTGAW